MPIYEYRCANGHQFEVTQSMSDDPVVACETCDAPVERVFHPVAVHFKGSGFHNTDYKKKEKGKDTGSSEGDSSSKPEKKAGEAGSGSKQDSKSSSGGKPKTKSSSSD